MVRAFFVVCAIALCAMGGSHPAQALPAPTVHSANGSPTAAPPARRSTDPDDSLRREAHVAGYAAFALTFGTVVWGMLTTAGTVRRSVRRQTTYGAHMVLSIMAMSFTALHAGSHLLKHTAPFSPVQALVPFASEFHVTLGVVAFELMVVAAVSVWIQRRLSYHRWHALHRIAYPAYLLVIGHVVLSAHHLTDGFVLMVVGTTVVCVAALAVVCLHPSNRIPAGEPA